MNHNNNRIRVFGVAINNVLMDEAVTMICNKIVHFDMHKDKVSLGFFVNVNSYNIAVEKVDFYKNLLLSDHIFADGIGVKIAAKKAGYQLKDNVNGTDMLPLLCEQLVKLNKGMYLLGAEDGIAQAAADNLCSRFNGLIISGCRNGFFNDDQTDSIINDINQSGCAILLVAFGSPLQEQWLVKNKDKLSFPYAIAVGGLFDFYSGKIKRAPLFLRKMKCEWIWRLMQEPKRMWRRYLLGNPLFLMRTYFNKKELKK